MKIYSYGLRILAALLICFFIIGAIFLPRETSGFDHTFSTLQADWYLQNEDGTLTPITIPSKVDTPRGEDTVIVCTLPEIPSAGYQLLIRSSQQDIYFYIDGELRSCYDTTDTRIWGHSSMSCNVTADVTDKDSGKQLKMIIRSTTSYSGAVNEMFIGTPQGILHHLLMKYLGGLIVAILLLFTSIITMIVCLFLQRKYNLELSMTSAAWVGIIVSVQAIVESRLRQYYVGNIELAGSVSYLLVGLIPISLCLYINLTQRRRYQKVAFIFLAVCFTNEILNIILQVTGIQDLLASMTRSYALFALSLVICIITTIIDIRHKQFNEIKVQMIGVFLAYFFGFAEILASTMNFITMEGVFINLGMFFLLAAAILDSIKQIMKINADKADAIASNKAKSGFLANMSHEIRTPINAILGMNEMIIRESSEPEIVKYSQDAEDAGNNLLEIVNDILDFSKIESGKMEIVPVDYSISKVIRELYKLVIGRANNNNLKLIINVDETLREHQFGDDVRVKQIVLNLLTNAIKYTDKGSVTLTVSHIDSHDYVGKPDMTGKTNLHIEVKDTGIGIKKEDLDKLFSNFERLDLKRNRSVEGTGLGLSITANLVHLMDGNIEVKSEYGHGSNFIVDIPQGIAENDTPVGAFKLEEEKTSTQPAKEAYRESFHAPNAHILVVDDTPMNIKIIKNFLKKTQLHIDEATCGQICIDMCRKKGYDLVLMDHMMPEMDGIETMHKLLDEKLVECPVIALTANAMAGMKEMYLAEGFSGYISKPVKSELLEAAMIEFLPDEKIELTS